MARVRPTRHRWRPHGSDRHNSELGAIAAELVIATPLLLLLIMAVIQFALWQHATHVAQAAAQQGLAVGRLQTDTAADGQTETEIVLHQLGNSVLVDPTVNVDRTDGATTVIVSGRAETIVGLFNLPVRAVASGPNDQFTQPNPTP